MMTTFKLVLEYDGTRYSGWQRQLDASTVQAAGGSGACGDLANEAYRGWGGSHGCRRACPSGGWRASKPIAAFRHEVASRLECPPPLRHQRVVGRCRAGHFHARYSATGKLYEYHILNRSGGRLCCGNEPGLFTTTRCRRDGRCRSRLLGSHDFSSFETAPTDNDNPHCRMQQSALRRQGDLIVLAPSCRPFLKQMVRSLVGTLVEWDAATIGVRYGHNSQGPLPPAAGGTAPPHGLYLVRWIMTRHPFLLSPR